MKRKSLIIILSVILNIALFSALVYFNKVNSRTESLLALYFVGKHLTGTSQRRRWLQP